MFTKVAFGLAIILATVSASLAASRVPMAGPSLTTVYNPYGAYVGADHDQVIRFELSGDAYRGRAN